MKSIAILGTVGLPASYGGFETLADNLVRYHDALSLRERLTVYCSSRSYPSKSESYLSAHLRYVPLNANGVQSVVYDICSLLSAVWHRNHSVLLLGVSGAVALPLVRAVSSVKIVTNIDGIEWKRAKWNGLARWFLRLSERIAVRYSHVVIADNGAIADYVASVYKTNARVIAYGGDHATAVQATTIEDQLLPDSYALSVCRIEPENNVEMIVEAFSGLREQRLIMVGNWESSAYGRSVRRRYGGCENVLLLDPIYDLGKLKTLRMRASTYVHGHSAGGTNPSLVEAMHFGKPVLAFDCLYNRHTTENKALFFRDSGELAELVERVSASSAAGIGNEMLEIAKRRYTWNAVAQEYFDLLIQ